MPGTRTFASVRVGEELPPLEKAVTLPRMVIYGASTWDFVNIHYDQEKVKALGFPAPVVDGQMMGGFLAQHVQDWAGPGAFLRKLSFRNRTMTFPGDTLTVRGTVVKKWDEGGEALVECDLWIDNQKGEKVIQPATAVVRLPR